ncbi:MAG: hypothetical protein JRG76_20015 [Deltaproteobacteria bacterium]|nr:hypothetical protein [Deltaproteobacteria bacterium]
MGNQIAVWQDPDHARAFETLGRDQARKWAAEKGLGDPRVEDDCASCHSTAHCVLDELVSRGLVPQSEEVCVACHDDGSPAWKPRTAIQLEGAEHPRRRERPRHARDREPPAHEGYCRGVPGRSAQVRQPARPGQRDLAGHEARAHPSH